MIVEEHATDNALDAVEIRRGSSWRQWGTEIMLSVGFFHAALFYPALAGWLVLLSLVFLLRLRRAATVRRAFYGGLLVGMGIMGPQLSFFLKIFGPFAVALWFLLAIWLAIFVAVGKLVERRFGRTWGVVSAPFLWMGLEYTRCELWPLKFTWLTPGFVLPAEQWAGSFHFLGIYGTGMLLVFAAAWIADRKRGLLKWVFPLVLPGGLMGLPPASPAGTRTITVAGVQLEDVLSDEIIAGLDKARELEPDAQLFVLSEYTFAYDPSPEVLAWCRQHGCHVMAGGTDVHPATDLSEEKQYNTAFVVGPGGEVIHKQVKSVPIQFMNDGLPARRQRIWDSPMGKIGIAICYDMNYIRVMDGLISLDAELLVIPAMDVMGWGEHAHRLSAQLAAVRAAEYGVPLFRLASSGFSRIATPDGKVVQEAPVPGQGEVIHGKISLPGSGRRPLDRWLVWPCVVFTVGMILFLIEEEIRRIRAKRPPLDA
ncbi:nitrilase-related carbon-nitrogen hydrolase [Luteolibacter marinus]|uniref:nitrilase-related carbon-nitrogen hydrolase n=1 Tax=Luteolibacter marinus TaxID=2776705 RepID=UPI001865E685|nr:nitrilase-related carbon-nitrogen hydrolase [Luteolibacter marinus]